MFVDIPISEASVARLREYATAAGKDLPTVLVEAIEEKLAASEPPDASRPASADQWIAERHVWAACHPARARFPREIGVVR